MFTFTRKSTKNITSGLLKLAANLIVNTLSLPGRTWILLYLGRTVYKHLWACLALYDISFILF